VDDPGAPLDGTSFFHAAMVVSDLDTTMGELGSTLGLAWAEPMVFTSHLWTLDGPTRWSMRVAYSTQGAQLLELIEARRVAGTSTFYDLAPGEIGRLHHVGAWSAALDRDTERLVAGGAAHVATVLDAQGAPQPLQFHRHATGLLVEVIDVVNRPGFEEWLAGGTAPK
jgi:hypothetical protein